MKSLSSFRLCALLFCLALVGSLFAYSLVCGEVATTPQYRIIPITKLGLDWCDKIVPCPLNARVCNGQIQNLSTGEVFGDDDLLKSGYYKVAGGNSVVSLDFWPEGWNAPLWETTEGQRTLLKIGFGPDDTRMPTIRFSELAPGPPTQDPSDEETVAKNEMRRSQNKPKDVLRGYFFCSLNYPDGFDANLQEFCCVRIPQDALPVNLNYESGWLVENTEKPERNDVLAQKGDNH